MLASQLSLLIEKLMALECSIGEADKTALRTMVMDVETRVLHIQRETIQVLQEIQHRREQQVCVQLSPAHLAKTGPEGEMRKPPVSATVLPSLRQQTA